MAQYHGHTSLRLNTAIFVSLFWSAWCVAQAESLHVDKEEAPYCHKTYFIQDYHMYGDAAVTRNNGGKWSAKNDSTGGAPRRLSAERLMAEVNLLHNDLRRERSRRNSLVDFVDSLISRYSNSSLVVETWRRYQHKYSVDLGHDGESNAVPVEPPGGQRAASADVRGNQTWPLEFENQDGHQQKSSGDVMERRAGRKSGGCGGGGKASRKMRKAMEDMSRNISSLKNSYGAIYRTYTLLASSHQRLQRETHRYVQQVDRQHVFYLAEMRRLGWALANETDLWHAGVRYLMGKMSCMDEANRNSEVCLDLDASPQPSTSTMTGQGEDAHEEAGTRTMRSTTSKTYRKLPSKDGLKLLRQVVGSHAPPPSKLIEEYKRTLQSHSSLGITLVRNNAGEAEAGTGHVVDVEAGVAGGSGEVTVASAPSVVRLDYKQLRESFTQAGLEVFKSVMEQLRLSRPRDCSEIDLWTQRQEPHQTIYLSGRRKAVRVYCDEGWTVIQHNKNSRVQNEPAPAFDSPGHQEEEDRGITPASWRNYRDGIGTPNIQQTGANGFFWIGNEYIHQLTRQGDYRLRIELGSLGWASYYKYSEYAKFKVGPEAGGYRLAVLSGTGTAGDVIGSFSTTPLSGAPFATRDRHKGPVQEALVAAHGVGWWYPTGGPVTGFVGVGGGKRCFSNLNAHRPWFCDQQRGLTSVSVVVMKIRPHENGRA